MLIVFSAADDKKGINRKVRSFDFIRLALFIFAAVFIIINSLRLTNNDFWCDEIYSINVAKRSYADIIEYSIRVDSNPPLYNMMLHLVCSLFGYSASSYHLAPMLAYAGILLISATVVYRDYGWATALGLMLFATFLDSSYTYITECRMYELAAFFVLLTFLSLHSIMKKNRKRDYAFFIIFSLCAAFTHYYCLVAVGFLYLFVLAHIYLHIEGRKGKAMIALVCIAALIYLPWAIVSLYDKFVQNTSEFWIEDIMSIPECIEYIFHSDLSYVFFILFILALILMYITNRKKTEEKSLIQRIKGMDPDTVWIIAGLVSIAGTTAVFLIISYVSTPLIYPRYLYTYSIIAWILFPFVLSRIDLKKFRIEKINSHHICAAFIALLLIFGAFGFTSSFDEENKKYSSTKDIVSITDGIMDAGDVIITDHLHLTKNVLKYYYPDLKSSLMEDSTLPKMSKSKHYMMYTSSEIGSDLHEQLVKKGYSETLLKYGDFAKIYKVYVYDINPIA